MQIMYYGRRGQYIAETIRKLCVPKAKLIACDSFDAVIRSIETQGGDPFKMGIIPILQERPDNYKTIAVINKLHIVSNTYISFRCRSRHLNKKSDMLRSGHIVCPR